MPTGDRTSPGCTCAGPGRALSTCGRSTYLRTMAAGEAQGVPPGPVGALRLHGDLLSEPFEDGLALLRVAEQRGNGREHSDTGHLCSYRRPCHSPFPLRFEDPNQRSCVCSANVSSVKGLPMAVKLVI